MIGKIMIGKSFNGCISYCLEDKKPGRDEQQTVKNRAEVLMYNQCFGNKKELIRQFNEVKQLNQKLSRPVMHITLSLAVGEKLDAQKLRELVMDCSKDLGFEKNQFLAIGHHDTAHQHIHIIANRIGFDRRTVSDSRNYQKMAAFCRKMEIKFGLKQIVSPSNFLPAALRQIPRLDIRKDRLKSFIADALFYSRSLSEFELRMKQRGYKIVKGRGISFIDRKAVKVKGSEMGYSLMKIEDVLQNRATRDALIQANENIKRQVDGSDMQKEGKGKMNDGLRLLLKPETGDNPQLIQKLRKKKRRRLPGI
jgi:hypothetical protein